MTSAPQHCPGPRELDDLELMIVGALEPRVNAEGSSVVLSLPPSVEDAALEAGSVELVDPEGLPLASVSWPAGVVTPVARPEYGPFRRLHLSPAEVREQYGDRRALVVREPLTDEQVGEVGGRDDVVVLALAGHGASAAGPLRLLRSCLSVTDAVVAVPLAPHPEVESEVLATYADPERLEYLEPADVRPTDGHRGLVVFFTGLSGSGKSTLARALMDRVLEAGVRTVTSLDGDVVRRNLSAGLTFSKEDRETNIRRIGWVAAQIAHHGGLAVCSPIAPFERTRADVRAMVEAAEADFFLVHVATPLEECERRDRKGLYAKARAGEIPEFTGISSPYEEPDDADVVVDTTGRTIEDALDDILAALTDRGLLEL